LLTQQLQGRSHLFWIERVDEYLQTHPLDGSESSLLEREIVDRFQPWLESITKPTISGFFKPDPDQAGMNLVVAPVGNGRRPALLAAALGVRPIQREFLEQLARHGTVSAYLFDEDKTVMASSQPDVGGVRLDMNSDPHLRPVMQTLAASGYEGNATLAVPFKIGSKSFDPSLLTADSIHVLDKHWFLLVASPLSDVDAVVRVLFHKAVFWAAFVAISMAAILVSTATQLIRSRMRLERVRHEMLQAELRQARQIQLAWLPDKTKQAANGLDIATLNRPANHISGDFYNFFDLPDGRTAVVIGDVTGHGIAAAFLMSTAQLLVRSTLPRVLDPGRCLEEVNRQLCIQVFNGQFVTMQILVIDPETGELKIGTAGHPPPLVSEGDGFSPLSLEPQLVLGVDPLAAYRTEQYSLIPGSELLLYTDGVVEAQNAAGKRLRLDGLRGALADSYSNAQPLLDAVLAAVNAFRGSEELSDDLTLVAIRFEPQEARKTPALSGAGMS
jgi:serine phosphatase RsbU (regulator of sigma subunit)